MGLRAIKSWYLVHKWTSLVSTAFLLMLCVTGLPLIFHHELEHALGYTVEAPPVSDPTQRADLDRIVASAKARKPGLAVQFLIREADEPEVWLIRLGKTAAAVEPEAFLIYDARTGAFLHEYPLREGILYVLLRLHIDMFAGLPGMLFLGFMGLLLVVSLVSGALLYGPFMRKLRFGTVRRRKAARTKWLDLHNLLGIVTLVWLTVVGVTGIINTLSIPIFGAWQATELVEMTAPYRDKPPLETTGAVDKALAAARASEPAMDLRFMAFPGNGFASPHHFVAFMEGKTPLTSRLLKPVLIDARTGEVVDKRELPWYVTALLVSRPLHFGDYGGMPLKILWAVLDILSIIVLASGLYLWIKRRNLSFEGWLARMQDDGASPAKPLATRDTGSA